MRAIQFIHAAQDPWRTAVGEFGPHPVPPLAPHSLLTPDQWAQVRDAWPADLPVGLLVPNTVDVSSLTADLPRMALVALQFPKWTDGRAYSQAHLLRTRWRYGGEVRATGEVLVDMLPLLQRTGFTAVQLKDGQSEASARRQLALIAAHYQGDVHEPRPAFARDAAAQGAA